ncbi:MAG: family 78 glycoside hydrolase catalytic domain [Lachnospiraceae bacterium]|nr:family 78 glycoside hydrolase catalytic domain [Lachnospiraceae bacterium]
MRLRGKWLSLLLVAALTVQSSFAAPFVRADQERTEGKDTKIYGLLTDSVENPVGIDDKKPHFSWKMDSDVVGQKQTAYQIVVKKENAVTKEATEVVWDSGKVVSDKSVDIAYAGEELESSATYHWEVTAWDKDDTQIASKEATFEMGLLEEDSFSDANWLRSRISSDPEESDEIDTSVYTIEMNAKFRDAIGFILKGTDTSNFYMWQINNNMEHGVEGTWVRPHVWSNGTPAMYNPENKANYNGDRLSVDLESNKEYNFKFVVDTKERKVETLIDNTLVHSMNCSVGDLSYSYVGFRQCNVDAISEQVWVNDLTITDKNGTVLYTNDYSSSENTGFSGGQVEDGYLHVSNGNGNGELRILNNVAPVNDEEEFLHYTLESDLTITGDSAGIVFSAANGANMYMWQINGADHKDTNGRGLLYLRPHIWANGTPYYAEYEANISSFFDYENDIKNKKIHVKIDVTKDSIKTYIEDTLVNTFDVAGKPGNLFDGRIGLRSGTKTETFTVDTLKKTSFDKNGDIIDEVNYDFEDGTIPFVANSGQPKSGKVVSGEYVPTPGANEVLTKAADQPAAMYRKDFQALADKTVVSAKVYATALGVFDLYMNGQRVGTERNGETVYDEMKPGWTDYSKRVLYYTYDVTNLIRQNAKNTILATVGSGWWTGRIAYGTYGDKPSAFLAKMLLTYADGTTETIVTDKTWKNGTNGTVRDADIWDGEKYDARYDSAAQISQPDYTLDASWQRPAYSGDFSGKITAQVGQSVQVRKELERKSLETVVYKGTDANGSDFGEIHVLKQTTNADEEIELGAGETAIFDVGQDMVGWPNIEISAPKGTVITTHVAEMLNDSGAINRGNDGPKGSLYMANYRSSAATGTYIAKGSETESYRPTFTFYGFRYVSVTATKPITLKKFRAEVLGSAIPEIGELETSSEDINQLISNILWGQRSNYLSVATDCPQRDERLGWSGDTQAFVGAAVYNGNVAGFFHKWAQDARDSQRDGQYTDVIPRSNVVGQGNLGWADAGIIVPYTIYNTYGDTKIVEESYASMKAYMDWLFGRGYVGANGAYGDWLAYESNDDNVKALLACAYYAYDTELMAKMAKAIGKEEDAAAYSQRNEEIKNYFRNRFMDTDGNLKGEYRTQTCYAWTIKTGMPKDENQKEILGNALAKRIENNGNKLGTGFLGTYILNNVLSDVGKTDVAYTLLLQRENPSWLYSIDQGATTIWERWNSYTKENGFGDVSMNSFNHYSYGAVLEWMYADMLGIKNGNDVTGYKHIEMKPHPDFRKAADIPANQTRITEVKGSYDSAYGKIKAAWKQEGGQFTYSATVPANTTATISVPLDTKQSLLVNNKEVTALTTEDGIVYDKTEDGYAVFEAVAGTFTFKTITPENPLDKAEEGVDQALKDAETAKQAEEAARSELEEKLAELEEARERLENAKTEKEIAEAQKAVAEAEAAVEEAKKKEAQEKENAAKQPQKPKEVVLANGQYVVIKGLVYKVTNSSKKSVEVSKTGKKTVKTVNIPATITVNNVVYNVTGIGKNAFAKCKKLKKATIGANVETLANGCFDNCSKLKTIQIKSKKVRKIGKNAFRKVYKKATFNVPKAKAKSYTKLLKKAGYKKGMKIVKKNY